MNRRKLLNRICALTVTAAMMGTTIMGAVLAYATDFAEKSLMEDIGEEVESPVGDAAESDAAEDAEILDSAAEEDVEESYVVDDEANLEIVSGEVPEEDSTYEELPEDHPIDESVTEENLEVKGEDGQRC